MKERPILFSGPMVRAILAGTKTQTRRVVMPQPRFHADGGPGWYPGGDSKRRLYYATLWHFRHGMPIDFCRFGRPGDRLWVRETWQIVKTNENPPKLWYRADPGVEDCVARSLVGWPGWRPAIHMPRAACRLMLEMTAVRVERLQDISEADAKAEGVDEEDFAPPPEPEGYRFDYCAGYARLWDSLNAKCGFGWGVNPWCWVIEFRRVGEERKAA